MKSDYNKKNINTILMVLIILLAAIMVVMVIFLVSAIKENNRETTSVTATTLETTSSVVPSSQIQDNEVSSDNNSNTNGSGNPSDKNGAATTTSLSGGNTSSDPSSWSGEQILAYAQQAVNKTKAYTGKVTVNHTETISMNLTSISGGSAIRSVAQKIIDGFTKPTNETLNYSGGYATDSDGNKIPLLLPKRGNFTMPYSGVASATASKSGNDIKITIQVVPETADMNSVPTYNSQIMGYLDFSALNISVLTIKSANVTYKGTTVNYLINSEGYVKEADYSMPMTGEGTGQGMGITGTATIEGTDSETWKINW